jgi:hypothetical protein
VPLAFYVYYRIDPAAAGEERLRVDQLFDRLQQRCKVRGRLLTKRDEPNLWMEAYEGVQDGPLFESSLQAEAASLGLEAMLSPGSRRNLESFQE